MIDLTYFYLTLNTQTKDYYLCINISRISCLTFSSQQIEDPHFYDNDCNSKANTEKGCSKTWCNFDCSHTAADPA